MRHPGGTPLGKKMTMVEWMVVMAILGILAAIILPSFTQTVRRAQREGYAASSQRPDVDAREGQDNVIELPATQHREERAARPSGAPGAGRLLSLIIWIAIFAAIANALRKAKAMRAAALRRPKDGDDAE